LNSPKFRGPSHQGNPGNRIDVPTPQNQIKSVKIGT
jgi:hypothetical protein